MFCKGLWIFERLLAWSGRCIALLATWKKYVQYRKLSQPDCRYNLKNGERNIAVTNSTVFFRLWQSAIISNAEVIHSKHPVNGKHLSGAPSRLGGFPTTLEAPGNELVCSIVIFPTTTVWLFTFFTQTRKQLAVKWRLLKNLMVTGQSTVARRDTWTRAPVLNALVQIILFSFSM